MEAWASTFIAVADQAIAGRDYEKLRAYFATLGKLQDDNWPALEVLSKTENTRYPDYAQYSKAWGARMNAIWNTARAEMSTAKK
jgi:cyclopropane fatty-acyl-phospholipid synthase-like methyltransferase